jgi:hypothetical protein
MLVKVKTYSEDNICENVHCTEDSDTVQDLFVTHFLLSAMGGSTPTAQKIEPCKVGLSARDRIRRITSQSVPASTL